MLDDDEYVNTIPIQNQVKQEVQDTEDGSGEIEMSSVSPPEQETTTLVIFLNEPEIEDDDETATEDQPEITEMLEDLDDNKSFIWKLKFCKAEAVANQWISLVDFKQIYSISKFMIYDLEILLRFAKQT